MKLLTTRVGTYLTGDDIADAVLSYGLALSRMGAVDIVAIPFLDGGTRREARFTIGWQSEASSVTRAEFSGDELRSADAVADLVAKTGATRTSRAEPFSADELHGATWYDDY